MVSEGSTGSMRVLTGDFPADWPHQKHFHCLFLKASSSGYTVFPANSRVRRRCYQRRSQLTYDFTPIADPTFDSSLPRVGPLASGVTHFRGVTGGVYKARERIHRSVADLRLLATPTSWGRVADPNPNQARFFGIRSPLRDRSPL